MQAITTIAIASLTGVTTSPVLHLNTTCDVRSTPFPRFYKCTYAYESAQSFRQRICRTGNQLAPNKAYSLVKRHLQRKFQCSQLISHRRGRACPLTHHDSSHPSSRIRGISHHMLRSTISHVATPPPWHVLASWATGNIQPPFLLQTGRPHVIHRHCPLFGASREAFCIRIQLLPHTQLQNLHPSVSCSRVCKHSRAGTNIQIHRSRGASEVCCPLQSVVGYLRAICPAAPYEPDAL